MRVMQMVELSHNTDLLRAVFDSLDIDGSGHISRHELEESFKGMSVTNSSKLHHCLKTGITLFYNFVKDEEVQMVIDTFEHKLLREV